MQKAAIEFQKKDLMKNTIFEEYKSFYGGMEVLQSWYEKGFKCVLKFKRQSGNLKRSEMV